MGEKWTKEKMKVPNSHAQSLALSVGQIQGTMETGFPGMPSDKCYTVKTVLILKISGPSCQHGQSTVGRALHTADQGLIPGTPDCVLNPAEESPESHLSTTCCGPQQSVLRGGTASAK